MTDPLPPSLKAELLRRRAAGSSFRRLAEWLLLEHGIERSLMSLHRLCMKNNVRPAEAWAPPAPASPAAPRPSRLDADAAAIQSMRWAGYSFREIIRQLELTVSDVALANFCRSRGFTPEPEELSFKRIGHQRDRIAWALAHGWTLDEISVKIFPPESPKKPATSDAAPRKRGYPRPPSPASLAKYIRKTGLTPEDRPRQTRFRPAQMALGALHDEIVRLRSEGKSVRQIVLTLWGHTHGATRQAVADYLAAIPDLTKPGTGVS